MMNIQKIKFNLLKFKRYIREYSEFIIESIYRKFVLRKKDVFHFLYHANYTLKLKKEEVLKKASRSKKVVFFVFRDCQMLDWFVPIHRSIIDLYGDEYTVLYVNYGSTLPRVGTNREYIPYLESIEKRLIDAEIPNFLHFSNREIPYYDDFPIPDVILSSEVIRHETFKCSERVYLPHYSIPKEKKNLGIMKHFNHLFLPSKGIFSYRDLDFNNSLYKVHAVGYPKVEYHSNSHQKMFDNDNPTIIYAPNLEPDVVLNTLEKGLIKVFGRMKGYNFLIKMHPTLANKTFNIYRLLKNETDGMDNIRIDTRSNIEDVGYHSSLMITDFGSVGGEYKLRFGKRIIYLEVPKHLEGGGDLSFRDHFADAVTTVEHLYVQIKQVLSLGEMPEDEVGNMRDSVLYHYGTSDREAAEAINRIISLKKSSLVKSTKSLNLELLAGESGQKNSMVAPV